MTSILDVGCGEDSPLRLFAHRSYRVGVDAHQPALERSRATGIHDEYLLGDVTTLEEMFEPGSFDAVVAFDVLEHLEQQDGLDLLRSMERIATRRVVVLTPNASDLTEPFARRAPALAYQIIAVKDLAAR